LGKVLAFFSALRQNCGFEFSGLPESFEGLKWVCGTVSQE